MQVLEIRLLHERRARTRKWTRGNRERKINTRAPRGSSWKSSALKAKQRGERTGGWCDDDFLGGHRLAGAFLAVLLVVAGRTLLDVLLVVLGPEGCRRSGWRDVDWRYYVVCEQRGWRLLNLSRIRHENWYCIRWGVVNRSFFGGETRGVVAWSTWSS